MLEPGKAAKTDKSSIITDAIRIVTQLRAENGQLRQLNKFLEVCIMMAHQLRVYAILTLSWLLLHPLAYAMSASWLVLELSPRSSLGPAICM